MTGYSDLFAAKTKADGVAPAFNAEAQQAQDHAAFRQKIMDRYKIAIHKAIPLTQSRRSDYLAEIDEVITEAGGMLEPEEVTKQQKRLASLKGRHVTEKAEIEPLKAELKDLWHLFDTFAVIERNTKGVDAATQAETQKKIEYLTDYRSRMDDADADYQMQEKNIRRLETVLLEIETTNTTRARKAAFADFLKIGPVVAAPMRAPATATFKNKSRAVS